MTQALTTKTTTPNSAYHIDSSPEPVDSSRWLTEYNELFYNDTDNFWEPPVSRQGLAQIANANAYHGSLLIARANYVAGRFKSGGSLRRRFVQAFCRDYFMFGDAALLKLRNAFGQVVGLHPLPSMYLRRRKNGDFVILERDEKQRVYKEKDVIFLPQYEPQQQIYGLPDYLGSIQSSLLNKDATLFRRRYYMNGAHMGFIFYATDPNLSAEDEEMLKEKIASSKGVGNFRSMFVNIPNGKEKGIQLIPVGDIATKDEFERIKNITAQDILVGHRFPSAKGGLVPQPGSNLGDPVKVGTEYAKDEVIPVCELIMDEVNSDPEIGKSLQLQFNIQVESSSS
ncbi:phage portal protein [Photobacterium galatheae]|uniref:Phage portal protein n=1 Tax=Photobacterium galatheae TaxID=1654360 RepID=A0A066RH20_9GAMM|nr:phage portal protein [Photobacterium galatheae]KDM89710.1 phage portal protein [Photobacterium galatheae]MCM0151538.1 phage portal protein [Photobacterium galatheae]